MCLVTKGVDENKYTEKMRAEGLVARKVNHSKYFQLRLPDFLSVLQVLLS
jgi:hypothetical protein